MPPRSPPVTPSGPGRWLLLPLLSLALTACGQSPSSSAKEPGLSSQSAALADTRVRLMAANISSGNNQGYDEGSGIRIFQGIKPDVVMIQEFNYGDNSTAAIRSFVDTTFGTNFSYFRETGAQIPNGIISRYPILASGEWTDTQVSNRDFAWARIDIPGPKDLWVVSVHLLTANSTVRNTEAGNLVQYIQNANIPAGDFLAIGGDFNSDNRSEPLFSTFSAQVVTASPYPADKNGNVNTNASRAKPYDHVLVNSNLRTYQTDTVIGLSTFAGGLVVDTRAYSPLSEISPAQSGDSGASNMQHMAIVKDFLVPSDGPSMPMPTGRVAVVVPNGGESWVAGSTRSISWTASEAANVKLEYSTDGNTWNVITASVPAADGGYSWQVPSPASAQVRVRVSDAADSSVLDTSDTFFAIVTSPPVDSSATITQETEGNNTAATANGRVGADKNVTGTLSASSDVDWFRFSVTAAGPVKVKLTMSSVQDLDWYLYSASNLSFPKASGASANNPEVGTWSAPAAGTYYVKVVGYSGATGSYTLNVSGATVSP